MVDTEQRVLRTNIGAGTEWESLSLLKEQDAIIVCDVTPYAPDSQPDVTEEGHVRNSNLATTSTTTLKELEIYVVHVHRKLEGRVAHIFPFHCKAQTIKLPTDIQNITLFTGKNIQQLIRTCLHHILPTRMVPAGLSLAVNPLKPNDPLGFVPHR